jgi:MFS family permease
MNTHAHRKFGPVFLAESYTPLNAGTYVFAAFVTVGLLAFVSLIMTFLLNANLNIPQAEQGRTLGLLGFYNEIVALLLVTPIGALADKIGRRPVYVLGFLWMAVGFCLYPLARNFNQLLACALFFSVGVAAVGCMMATILADTPREDSRGPFVGITGFVQGIGVVLIAVVLLSSLPKRFVAQGMDASRAAQITLWCAAGLCAITALVSWLGLKKGTASVRAQQLPLRKIIAEGATAASRNPVIWFGYMLNFAAFADRIVVGTFFSNRLQASLVAGGATATDALDRARPVILTANGAGLIFAIVFGLMLRRIDRIAAGVIAMLVASIGYFAGGFVGDPRSASIMPVAIVLGLGQVAAIVSSQVVLGREAPIDVRGAVFGLASVAASTGILFTTFVGGQLYDKVGQGGPFFLIGAINFCIMLFGVRLMRGAPQR